MLSAGELPCLRCPPGVYIYHMVRMPAQPLPGGWKRLRMKRAVCSSETLRENPTLSLNSSGQRPEDTLNWCLLLRLSQPWVTSLSYFPGS